MQIEKIGPFSVIILLNENENSQEEFLIEQARKTLQIGRERGMTPDISLFSRDGRRLVIMELRPRAKIFEFESTDDAIDAARLLGSAAVDCEILGDGAKVYIKTENFVAWNLLSEYGKPCEEKTGLRKLGNCGLFG